MHDGGDGYTHFALSAPLARHPDRTDLVRATGRPRFPHRKMDLAANTTVVRGARELERSVIRVYSIKQSDTTLVSHRASRSLTFLKAPT